MIVTIHQPNFFPWLPFYEKIRSADVFVILRHCQFEKNNYQNRFQYRDRWHTMSVNKGLEPIINKRYVNPSDDWNKIKANLHDKRAILSEFDDCLGESLYEMNRQIILKTMTKLGIKTQVEYDVETELTSTDRLVEICKSLGATKYLAGRSGTKYMDLSKFESAGIEVDVQVVPAEQTVHVLDIL